MMLMLYPRGYKIKWGAAPISLGTAQSQAKEHPSQSR